MKIIDLSVTISEDIKEPLPTKIEYENHKEGAKKVGAALFGGITDCFIDGNGPAGEMLTVTSHCGTHVDAPYHYFPTCEGKPSRTIEEMPLDWFFVQVLSWILRISLMAICLNQRIYKKNYRTLTIP